MPELKGSKTEANIKTAFSNECMARVRYSFYESKAKAEGFEQIAGIFKETSDNEKEHAEIWFKQLNGGIGDTQKNLSDGANNEKYEWSNMYSSFAATASDEGFEQIAALFEKIGSIEKEHEERYRKLLANTEEGMVFAKSKETTWICRNCGYVHKGTSAPDVCPVCTHPKGYFEVKSQNY